MREGRQELMQACERIAILPFVLIVSSHSQFLNHFGSNKIGKFSLPPKSAA